jgi:hypothetical protein
MNQKWPIIVDIESKRRFCFGGQPNLAIKTLINPQYASQQLSYHSNILFDTYGASYLPSIPPYKELEA